MKPNMKWLLVLPIMVAVLTACQPSEEQRASALVTEAQSLVENGQWRQARIVLDSLHKTYPKQVVQRRAAKALGDSITYMEAQRSVAYADSLLQLLLPQADELLRQFRYEKDDRYEDHGRYVSRLLATGSNTSRNFLQAYVRDDRMTIVKSFYYGAMSVGQQSLLLSANGEEVTFRGNNHSFNAEGWHEIMTLEDTDALQLLNFVSTHADSRVRVKGEGDAPDKAWVYYLTDKEKKALVQTYQLGFLMKDIRQLEEMLRVANAQVLHYESKHRSEIH